MCMSADGYVTTPDGWPVQLADPAFAPGESYGFPEFQQSCDAALMGRTTFEPALSADRWPWPNLDVFVLGSPVRLVPPTGWSWTATPCSCWESSGRPTRRRCPPRRGPLVRSRLSRALGALDKLGLIVLPLLIGEGMRLTPWLGQQPTQGDRLESERALPGGSMKNHLRLQQLNPRPAELSTAERRMRPPAQAGLPLLGEDQSVLARDQRPFQSPQAFDSVAAARSRGCAQAKQERSSGPVRAEMSRPVSCVGRTPRRGAAGARSADRAGSAWPRCGPRRPSRRRPGGCRRRRGRGRRPGSSTGRAAARGA